MPELKENFEISNSPEVGEDLLTVVILAYNRCQEVLITLTKLKHYCVSNSLNFRIIVVDNASIDDTSTQVIQLHPDVDLIKKKVNNGIAGWNEGFMAVQSKYILVLDDDSCIEKGLSSAIVYLESNPEIGILALDIVDEQLKGDPHLDPEKAWKHLEPVAGFIGCGAIIRTELYHLIGGFAEWIFVYTHEFEYTMRCLSAGYKTVFFNQAFVVHRASQLNRSVKRQRVFATRNEMAIIYIYFATNRPKYLARTFFNNLKFVKREGLSTGIYVLQGLFAFFKLRRRLKKIPVSQEVQDFYADNFWSTKPIIHKD